MANPIRLNITVPLDVAETLKEMAGPREQSRFIANSVRAYAKELKRLQLLEELKEGYIANAEEGLKISQEFDRANQDGLADED